MYWQLWNVDVGEHDLLPDSAGAFTKYLFGIGWNLLNNG